jgi:hypothetical protein
LIDPLAAMSAAQPKELAKQEPGMEEAHIADGNANQW